MRQGNILFEYIKNYQSLSTNLIEKYNVASTLNPRVHYAKELFPKGLAVDYIFTSPEIKVKQFRVIDDTDLSDHFELICEFEI